jgi:D-alanyl-D-alanine carboxypeptidase
MNNHPIQKELTALVDAGLPGVFVYMQDADGSSQFHTAGVADLTSKTIMTPDCKYRAGSTTKTFTSVVTLQLILEGRLSLADTMKDRMPDVAIPNNDVLTVEHLLRMRSGLFDFEDDPSLLGNLDAHLQPCTLKHAIDLSIKHPAVFEPGKKYTYCNTNFCVLELLIERITGHSLAYEFGTRILDPLNLQNTSYPAEDNLTLPEPYIRGYERTDDGWRECSEVFFGRGDGALITTAADVAKFFRALLIDHSLLSPRMLQQMMTIIQDDPPADKLYGLGLIADPLPCGIVWGHSGAGFGYRNFPFMNLEIGRFAVFMQNGTYGFRVAKSNPPGFSNEFRAIVSSQHEDTGHNDPQ